MQVGLVGLVELARQPLLVGREKEAEPVAGGQ
jgi:hypothetical protein